MKFPTIHTIEEAVQAIQGASEFQLHESDGFIFIKYHNTSRRTFPDPSTACDERSRELLQIRRECRGIGFDKKTGKIATRKFHKFFNINEIPETSMYKIDWNREFVVIDKIDGSLVSPVLSKNKVLYTTMAGITSFSTIISAFTKYCKSGGIEYDAFCEKYINKGMSPLFEWCSNDSVVVIKYPRDMLTLIGMRNTTTGDYVPYFDLVEIANEYNIPIVEAWANAPKNPEELISTIRSKEGAEGYIICFNNGEMYKCKTNYYMRLHGFNPNSIKEKYVVSSFLDLNLDDIISLVDNDAFRLRLQLLRDSFQKGLDLRVKQIQQCIDGQTAANPIVAFVCDQLSERNDLDSAIIAEMLVHHLKEKFINTEFASSKANLYSFLQVDMLKLLTPYCFDEKSGILRPKEKNSREAYAKQRKNKKDKKTRKSEVDNRL